jgi:hypothetical protein
MQVRLAAVSVAMAVGLAGCIFGSNESASGTPGPPLAGLDLVGNYTTTVGPEDEFNDAGEWEMQVDEDFGVNLVTPDGTNFSPGIVTSASDEEITFAADPNCDSQPGAPTEGRYSWSLNGDELTFTKIADSCNDRIDILTHAPWERTE